MSGEPPPEGAQNDPPSWERDRRSVGADGSQASPSDRSWGVVFGGAVLGFLTWVVGMFFLIMATYDSMDNNVQDILPWLLATVILGAVALILWPRTRRLGEGLLLGFAIGLVVAGGICLPLVLGAE